MGGRKGVKQNFWKGTEMYNYIGYGGMDGWMGEFFFMDDIRAANRLDRNGWRSCF